MGWAERCVPILKLLSQYIITDFRLLQLNGVLKVVGLPLAVAHGLTLEWIVGFWDAEGSVSTVCRPRVWFGASARRS